MSNLFEPLVPDLGCVGNASDLRAALHAARREGRCAWIRLGGLCAERDRDHQGLMRELSRLGLGGDGVTSPRPECVVLDWSSTESCTADGLALFVVMARALLDRSIRLIVCAPGAPNLLAAVENAGIRAACGTVDWISGDGRSRSGIDAIVPAAIFRADGDRRPAGVFGQALFNGLQALRMQPDDLGRIVATFVDLVQNVISHSGADHACAVALARPRCRPVEVEVGLADCGCGIANAVLAQERHAWLASLTDGAVASAVLSQGLSRRVAEDGGGALTALISELVRECGASIVVRSGAALLTLAQGKERFSIRHLSCGWGTQTLIRLRVRA